MAVWLQTDGPDCCTYRGVQRHMRPNLVDDHTRRIVALPLTSECTHRLSRYFVVLRSNRHILQDNSRYTEWRKVGVIWVPLFDKSLGGGSYMNTQCSEKAYATSSERMHLFGPICVSSVKRSENIAKTLKPQRLLFSRPSWRQSLIRMIPQKKTA